LVRRGEAIVAELTGRIRSCDVDKREIERENGTREIGSFMRFRLELGIDQWNRAHFEMYIAEKTRTTEGTAQTRVLYARENADPDLKEIKPRLK
jgi:hypothetical protein